MKHLILILALAVVGCGERPLTVAEKSAVDCKQIVANSSSEAERAWTTKMCEERAAKLKGQQ